MNYFIVPKERELQTAIEEAVRNKAWMIVPYTVDIKQVIEQSCNMGFVNELKVCYWDEYNFVSQTPCVFLCVNTILSEMMGRDKNKNDNIIISMEANDDSVW